MKKFTRSVLAGLVFGSVVVQFLQPVRAQILNPQVQSVATLQLDLHTAICAQKWDEAIQLTNLLIGSDEVQPAYREQLVTLRYSLTTYRNNRTVFSSMPGCPSIATGTGNIPTSNGSMGTTGSTSAATNRTQTPTPIPTSTPAPTSTFNWEQGQKDLESGRYNTGVNVPLPSSSVYNGSGGYGGGGYSGSGRCNTPSDTDRNGNRCGGRAASERPGGR